jgi:hypothetical protein
VTVAYATQDGTDTARHYLAKPGRWVSAWGDSEVGGDHGQRDTAVEGNEHFFLNLSGATNATIAVGQGKTTIVDDETIGLTSAAWSGAPRRPGRRTASRPERGPDRGPGRGRSIHLHPEAAPGWVRAAVRSAGGIEDFWESLGRGVLSLASFDALLGARPSFGGVSGAVRVDDEAVVGETLLTWVMGRDLPAVSAANAVE